MHEPKFCTTNVNSPQGKGCSSLCFGLKIKAHQFLWTIYPVLLPLVNVSLNPIPFGMMTVVWINNDLRLG